MFRAAELSQSIWFSRSKERDPEEAKAMLEERLKKAEIRRKVSYSLTFILLQRRSFFFR